MKRVLLAPIGSTGDALPLAILGKRLQADGWHVSACATRDLREMFETRGIAFCQIDVDARDFAGTLDGGLVDMLRVGTSLRPAATAALLALDDAVRDVDLVVGAGLQLFAPPLAAARGAQYLYASTAPTNERAAGLPPHFLPFYGLGRLGSSTLWALQNTVFDRLFSSVVKPAYERAGQAGRPRHLLASVEARPNVLGLYDAPIVGANHRGAPPLGACLRGDDDADLPGDLESFLEDGPPPVYVGFGSMPARDPQGRTTLVLAALAKAGLRGVLEQGWGGLAGHVTDADGVYWLPPSVGHRRLLPRMAAVVHHGGGGTTATAARAGVPQVIVPHITDQFYFGRRVQALGVGPKPLPAKRLTAARLGGRLHLAVHDAAMGDAARALGARLGGVDGPGAAVAALERIYASK